MRTSKGRYLWSTRRTTSPSSHTVRSSRGVPSTTRRTCVPLRLPQGGEEAREARTTELLLHVPSEGGVVGDLVFDLREFLAKSPALVVDRAGRIEETLLPLTPPVEFLLGRVGPVRHLIAPGPSEGRVSGRGSAP